MATVMSSNPMTPPPADVGTLEPVNDDILYEVVDNQIRELPPMSARETDLASTLDSNSSARLPGTRVSVESKWRCSF